MRRLLFVLIAVLLISVPTSSHGKPRFGFNDWYTSQIQFAGQARKAGANTARVNLAWNGIYQGTWYNWADSDKAYNGLLAEGLTPLFAFYATEGKIPTANEFSAFTTEFAKRYPQAIIQVWNEPNIPNYGLMSVDRTVAITNAAEKAIHDINPEQIVLGPAMAPVGHWEVFLRAVYTRVHGVEVAVHIYPEGEKPIEKVEHTYKTARLYGDVWVTELGIKRNVYGRKQAKLTGRAYTTLARMGAAAIIIHRLVPGEGEWEENSAMNVLKKDGTPNSTYKAVKRARNR